MHFVFKIILRFYNLVSPLFCPDSRTNDSLGRYTCADPKKIIGRGDGNGYFSIGVQRTEAYFCNFYEVNS